MSRIRKKPQVRKDEILDTAQRLFIEKGLINVSVADIAREAGIARPTFYEYYTDKIQILVDLVDRVATQSDYTAPIGGTTYEKLKYIAADLLRRIDQNRTIYYLFLNQSPVLSDSIASSLKKWRHAHQKMTLTVMEKAIAQNELNAGITADDASFVFLALVGQRAGDILIAEEEIQPEAEAERLVKLAWCGISKKE